MDFFKPLLPYGGGIAVILVALWCLKQFFGESFKESGKRFAQWLHGGNRTLGRRRQRRYRKNLLANTSKHPLGFLRDQTIEIDRVHVPLQFTHDGQRLDVYKEIRQRKRVVILGGAGAGKSMLLKSSAFRWAKGDSGSAKLPILVELHRYNEEGSTLLALAEEALARNGLRAAGAMLVKALDAGKISLLLDGLDEVSTSRRAKAMQEIRSTAETYPSCQFVVTCRDATYDGGLAPTFEDPVTIADFDDAAMRRFLLLWFTYHLKRTKDVRQQVDRMMADLRSNPSVLRLARNPLLLTIMASLHQMDPGLGPSFIHSRAEFYREAIDHLLRRDFDLGRHEKVAEYRAGHKLLVLRRIALHTQGADDNSPDGRAVSERDALSTTKALLAELNMEPAHARPMFEEIVNRSELLIPVDGARLLYEFPHLTLQEYLAAVELGDDPDLLLKLYRTNPTRWRETVKLWCAGVNRDCTKVIQGIFTSGASDPILALECLGEAKKVDDRVAAQIVNHFQDRLGMAHTESHLVTAALGTLAGEGGPRGKAVYDFLRNAALLSDESKSRAAMNALAASRLPAAVQLLASLATHRQDARDALKSMGEQAVPELVSLASGGSLEAIDDIAEVGTPSAALGLCDLLWDDSPVAHRAAWRLGGLLDNTDVEQEIRLAPIDPPRVLKRLDWVWEPFDAGNVAYIAGRIAYLIANSTDPLGFDGAQTLDARLALPLASFTTAIEHDPQYAASRDDEIVSRTDALLDKSAHKRASRLRHGALIAHAEMSTIVLRRSLEELEPHDSLPICLDFLERAGATERTLKLWRCIPPRAAVLLASGAFWHGKPTRKVENDWRRVNEKLVDDETLGAIGVMLIVGTALAAVALGFVRAITSLFGVWQWGDRYLHVLVVLPPVIAAMSIYASRKSGPIAMAINRALDPILAAAVIISATASGAIGVATIANALPSRFALILLAIALCSGIVLLALAIKLSDRLTSVFLAAFNSSRAQAGVGASIIADDGGAAFGGSPITLSPTQRTKDSMDITAEDVTKLGRSGEGSYPQFPHKP